MKKYKDIIGDGGSNIVEQVTGQARRVSERLASVKHVVAVMSGKGGVGKSSVTVNLAAALALAGERVAIVDADINGPSIAKMTGVSAAPLQRGATGILPPVNPSGIKVMSMDLFLPDESSPVLWDAPTQKDAFTWRGMMEAAALREFLSDTEWGELDYLLLDLPPGTDKLPNIVDLLPQLSGTVMVTIPSGVSRFVVGKSVKMARELLQTPVIGLIENMSAYVCVHCGEEEALFPGGSTGAMAAEFRVPFLGKIPFDPRIAACADDGSDFMKEYSGVPAADAIGKIAAQVKSFFPDRTAGG